MNVKAILFDAYGTLLDVGSVGALAEQLFPGKGSAISRLWREKQLQYSWIRTLSGRYADFWQVTGEALDYTAAFLGLAMSPEHRAALLEQYLRLSTFPEAAPALQALAGRGARLAVLSNGTPAMLEGAFTHAGLRPYFTALLSVDVARAYKTAPAAYQLAVDYFGVPAAELLLVSSNGWDVAGGAAFGFRTFWVNRGGAPVEQLGVTPDAIGSSLFELADWLHADAQTPI